jgi:hypothetical protein
VAACAATALCASAAVVPVAHGSSTGRTTMRSDGRSIAVDIAVDHIAVRHGRMVAVARAASTVRTRDGRLRAASQNVTLAVKQGTNCRILDLTLQKLRLTLLGLTVDTSAVNLHVTGNTSASLGKLFCQLASGLKLSTVAKQARVARVLNHRMAGRRMHVVSFRSRIEPKATAAQASPVCPVLSLTLGPLNLDLLGLRVDLYGLTSKDPVVVTVTADPNGGSLGKLFCQLAQNAQAQSTA